jgi:hypothetical protein
MKLSKKVTAKIQSAIDALDRGLAFIDNDKTRIVRITQCAALPRDNWTSQERETGIAIEKQIGSDLCYLRNARSALVQLITPVIREIDSEMETWRAAQGTPAAFSTVNPLDPSGE